MLDERWHILVSLQNEIIQLSTGDAVHPMVVFRSRAAHKPFGSRELRIETKVKEIRNDFDLNKIIFLAQVYL